jgi:hypothetical protein
LDEQNKKFEPIPKELNTLGKEVVDATFKVPKKNWAQVYWKRFMKLVYVMSFQRKKL